MGDVVYVEVPPVGESLTQGETFGVVESVKVCRSADDLKFSSDGDLAFSLGQAWL